MNTQARAGLVAKLPLNLRRKLRRHYDAVFSEVKKDDSAYWGKVVTDSAFQERLQGCERVVFALYAG